MLFPEIAEKERQERSWGEAGKGSGSKQEPSPCPERQRCGSVTPSVFLIKFKKAFSKEK